MLSSALPTASQTWWTKYPHLRLGASTICTEWNHLASSLKYIYPLSVTVWLLFKTKARHGTGCLLTLRQWLLRASSRERKPRKPDHPLISNPSPAAFLSPLSFPYKIRTAQGAVRWALPRDVHSLAQQPAADSCRFCSLSEQHYLESLLHLMTNLLQANGNMIYFSIFIYQVWLKLISW